MLVGLGASGWRLVVPGGDEPWVFGFGVLGSGVAPRSMDLEWRRGPWIWSGAEFML